jgi:rod shape determining protein RodA
VVGGLRVRLLAQLGVCAVIGVVGAVHFGLLHAYQLARMTAFVNQNQNTSSLNYQLNLSKITIGSGGLHGSGLYRGVETNLGGIPNQSTDFIFTAVGEQLGFVGSAVVLGLFALIAFRVIRAVQVSRDLFGRLVCAGALAFIVFSVFQNVGMTIGIMPITGIPLPFMSYGGTALVSFFAAIGLVVNVGMRRGVRRAPRLR